MLKTFFNQRLPVADFNLPQVPTSQNRTLSALAEDYRTACGCALSGFLMTIAAASIVLAQVVAGELSELLTLAGAGRLAGAIVIVVAVVAGCFAYLRWWH